jgi:ribosomal subunit interface protein
MLEISYFGRRAKISDSFKELVEKKSKRIEPLVGNATLLKVELSHENNPRLTDISEKIELTLTTENGLLRSESSASDAVSALDLATDKLIERLRRISGRKKVKKAKLTHKTHFIAPHPALIDIESVLDKEKEELAPTHDEKGEFYLGDSPIVIRKKQFKNKPMTLDDAIYKMETLDYDFFIFVEKETNKPSVVYRRHGWSYGVLQIEG